MNNSNSQSNSIVEILQAWRLWLLGAILGAVLSLVLYQISPPPFLADAVILIDFNEEEIWPNQPELVIYSVIAMEVIKLEEGAWSDETLEYITNAVAGVTISELRDDYLQFTPAGNGPWTFYAKADDPELAAQIATAWAEGFIAYIDNHLEADLELVAAREDFNQLILENPYLSQNELQEGILQITEIIESSSGISPDFNFHLSQTAQIPTARTASQGIYIFSGSLIGALLVTLFVLLKKPANNKTS